MWMKAVWSDWNADHAKIRYSAAVKEDYEDGRNFSLGDLTALLQTPCTYEIV